MLPKYTVEYTLNPRGGKHLSHYGTDDPIACEEFVAEVLDRGLSLNGIKYEGVDLPRPEFDRMVKTAAGMMAAKRVCAALHIKPEEEKYRFGFAC